MVQYIIECVAFQLVFLIIYDLFLKRETFFQWNRLYLIATYIMSIVLPWIKIEALKTEVPVMFQGYPEYLWNVNDAAVTTVEVKEPLFQLSWPYMFFLVGVALATLFFVSKLYRIYKLRKEGEVHYFKDFTRIIIANNALAFSFFKSIFLGDKVFEKDHESIVQHELVHIRQKHSYDLMFFEIMRIVGWFNPLVYVYQGRISELHEFIADAKVAKTNKKEQYELMLSQVFQTQNISFINQFFKSSLIKKRIVMLQKSKSKRILQLKYLLLLPLILGMLAYTSIQEQESENNGIVLNEMVLVGYSNTKVLNHNDKLKEKENNFIKNLKTPSVRVDEMPVFPGCEDNEDQLKCFQEKFMSYLGRNFVYPEEAKKNGVQGTVLATFEVNESGNFSPIRTRMLEDSSEILENEAKRLISLVPNLDLVGIQGKLVPVQFTIPLTFQLR